MRYWDEEIALLRNRQKKRRYVNSMTGMYVGERLFHFRDIELSEGIHVRIPEGFDRMPSELAEKKFPSIHRPQIILSDSEGSICLTFSLYEGSAGEPEAVEEMLESFRQILKGFQPSIRFTDSGSQEDGEKMRGWIGFISSSLGGGIYNVLSFLRLRRHSVLGMSSCPEQEMGAWKPIMLEVLATIEEREGEHETD